MENEADKKIIWEKLNLEFTTSLADDESKLARLENLSHEDNVGMLSKTTSDLKTIVSKIQDCVPNFPSEIDDLHFIGSGIRQKNGIKIYAVAMYGAPALLDAESHHKLHDAARTFESTSRTTFVLEMVLNADAETVAESIASSVKLRYQGPHADVEYLESLIAEGVKGRRGQTLKGKIFRFDCTEEGVRVFVDGTSQETAKCKGLGSAFVDVFMDSDSVSPSLVKDCLQRNREMAQRVEVISATANMPEEKNPESKRTMLSLRILMKRLSKWQMKTSAD